MLSVNSRVIQLHGTEQNRAEQNINIYSFFKSDTILKYINISLFEIYVKGILIEQYLCLKYFDRTRLRLKYFDRTRFMYKVFDRTRFMYKVFD